MQMTTRWVFFFRRQIAIDIANGQEKDFYPVNSTDISAVPVTPDTRLSAWKPAPEVFREPPVKCEESLVGRTGEIASFSTLGGVIVLLGVALVIVILVLKN